MIADGDSSWFNNPQYRLSCALATRVTISLIPVSLGEEGGGDADALAASSSLPLVQLTVAELPKGTAQDAPFLGDCLLAQVVATDRGEQVFRQKGQEASIWDLRLAPAKTYFIVPNTARRGQTCECTLRPLCLSSCLPSLNRTNKSVVLTKIFVCVQAATCFACFPRAL